VGIAIQLAAVALLATAAGGAPAPAPGSAWRGARWGMSVAEVLAAFPGEATRLDPEEKLSDGRVVAVGIERHVLAGQAFRVRFVFAAGKLELVSLRTPASTYAQPALFEEVQAQLAAALGTPDQQDRDDNFIDLRQARWLAPGLGVDVKYIPGVVVVLYHPGSAPAPAPQPPADGRPDAAGR
jgi:hypothetical protein